MQQNTPQQKTAKYVNPYRLSERTMKLWSRAIFITMGVGFGSLVVIFIVMAAVYGDAPEEDIPSIMMYLAIASAVLAVGVPLLLGAIIGGIAINRLGWLPLVIVIGGVFAAGLSVLDGFGYLLIYGIIAMVVGTVGIYLIAKYRSRVDIWLGLPTIDSPRLYIRKDDKNDKA